MFERKINREFSLKLHNIELQREKLRSDHDKLDDENNDNESSKKGKDEKKLKKRRPSIPVTECIKDGKITTEISIIEQVRKLHEAYQFILSEHQRRLELKKRRATTYTSTSSQ